MSKEMMGCFNVKCKNYLTFLQINAGTSKYLFKLNLMDALFPTPLNRRIETPSMKLQFPNDQAESLISLNHPHFHFGCTTLYFRTIDKQRRSSRAFTKFSAASVKFLMSSWDCRNDKHTEYFGSRRPLIKGVPIRQFVGVRRSGSTLRYICVNILVLLFFMNGTVGERFPFRQLHGKNVRAFI